MVTPHVLFDEVEDGVATFGLYTNDLKALNVEKITAVSEEDTVSLDSVTELSEGLREHPGAHSDVMNGIETPDTHLPEGLVANANERENTEKISADLGQDRGLIL